MSGRPEEYPFNTFAGARHVATVRPPFNAAGGQVVKHVCACGWETDWWPLAHEFGARAELAEHHRGLISPDS